MEEDLVWRGEDVVRQLVLPSTSPRQEKPQRVPEFVPIVLRLLDQTPLREPLLDPPSATVSNSLPPVGVAVKTIRSPESPSAIPPFGVGKNVGPGSATRDAEVTRATCPHPRGRGLGRSRTTLDPPEDLPPRTRRRPDPSVMGGSPRKTGHFTRPSSGHHVSGTSRDLVPQFPSTRNRVWTLGSWSFPGPLDGEEGDVLCVRDLDLPVRIRGLPLSGTRSNPWVYSRASLPVERVGEPS